MSASRTTLGRLFQTLGAKYEKDLPPAVDFDILGIIKWPELENAADVNDYNAIRGCSSTEELNHSGLYK